MSEKLKPCAHCGGEAGTNIAGGGVYIFCTDCGIGVRKHIHPGVYLNWKAKEEAEERQAIEAWNRRHHEQETSSTFDRCMSK